MCLKNTGDIMSSMKNLIMIFIFACLLSALSGCSTTVLKMSYSPAYTEKRALVESTINTDKQVSILLLRFKDKRGQISDPMLIYKRVSLEGQPLSEYLHNALLKDLKLLGFNVAQDNDKKLDIKEIESGKKTVGNSIRFVLAVEVNKSIPDYESNFWSVQPYSTFDFQIVIWDNIKAKIVYNKRLFKKIMGAKTSSITFKDMVTRLLNEDLTVINIEIAEILTGL